MITLMTKPLEFVGSILNNSKESDELRETAMWVVGRLISIPEGFERVQRSGLVEGWMSMLKKGESWRAYTALLNLTKLGDAGTYISILICISIPSPLLILSIFPHIS